MTIKVKLTQAKHLEIRGVMKTLRPGQVIEIGKGLAREWIIDGSAIDLSPKAQSLSPEVFFAQGIEKNKLVRAAHEFWFSNQEGTFDLEGYKVTRDAMHLYGGPNPEFSGCKLCQGVEWVSRLKQEDMFIEHSCITSELCKVYCSRQGNSAWTHYHQNFWYAAYVDPSLDAPKCAMICDDKTYIFFTSHHCDQATHVFLRQLAQICQYELVKIGSPIDPKKYDFAYSVNAGWKLPPSRPPIPVWMYGHDLWKRREQRQYLLDYWKPEWFWTPFLSSWKKHFKFPENTSLYFRPVPASMYFTQSNLDDLFKVFDLLVVGATGNPVYHPRRNLSQQLTPLAKKHRVLFHHNAGSPRSKHKGSNQGTERPFANAWSAFLGSARYVAFAGISEEPQPIFFKYYEVLGSGTIPIMPTAPDLKLLGVKPWEHFIPVESIIGDNDKMTHYLDNYDQYKHIAENAVKWHEENADKLLFEGIQDMVQLVTDNKYPRRLY